MPQELEIREACTRGDFDVAVTALLASYGPELLGYLGAISLTSSQAREVYCMLAEDLWRGLPSFEWRCSARAWGYTLARNARARYLSAETRRAAREQPASSQPWLRELVDRTRSPTPLHRRSEIKDGVRALRARLEEHEQTLLMLRVDRDLSWQELVVILDERRADEAVATAAARLRQRFQALKDKLRTMAVQEGILKRDGG